MFYKIASQSAILFPERYSRYASANWSKNNKGNLNSGRKTQRGVGYFKKGFCSSRMETKKVNTIVLAIPRLTELSSAIIASEIDKNPNEYVTLLENVNGEFLKHIVGKLSYPSLSKFIGSGKYKDLINARMLDERMKVSEDHYRHLFATQRNHPDLSDPHLMMISVFDHFEEFQHKGYDDFDKDIPRVLEMNPEDKATSGLAIVPKEEFSENFALFTENQLAKLDWSNVFVAGGSVLASLLPVPRSALKQLYRGFQVPNEQSPSPFSTSDIDLFIYGLTPVEAIEKLINIREDLKKINKSKMLVVRTPQSVTFVTDYPHRHIQVILRIYKSPAEILMGFDIDCCCVGFDGTNVWSLPRFHRSVTKQYNLVDLSRRSTTYESRLLKYSYRGFEVAVPGLRKAEVDMNSVMTWSKGLGLLLRLEIKKKNKMELWDLYGGHRNPLFENANRYYGKRFAIPRDLRANKDTVYPRLVEAKIERGYRSDYSTVFLPWGPKWNAQTVRKFLDKKERAKRSHYANVKTVNYGYSSDVEGILTCYDGDESEDALDSSDIHPHETHIVRKRLPLNIKWLTTEPGRQYIGSFHPENPEDWDAGVYVTKATPVGSVPTSLPFDSNRND